MAKKITTQNLVDTLRQRGWNAQQVEPFVDAFFESLNDGITRDGIVKVKGLGTFKTIKVADRGSVDVNTGERIVIPGHNKLKFVEEDKVNAVLNGAELVEPTPAPKKVAARKVETPAIDNASPSISPLLEEGAREASSPSTSLPPGGFCPPITGEPKGVQRPLIEGGHSSRWWIWVSVALIVALIAICLVSIFANKEPLPNPLPERGDKVEIKSSPLGGDKRGVYTKVHPFQKGESLTTISVLHYNTTDSVPRIMELNGLTDTSFIPLGTELKLP